MQLGAAGVVSPSQFAQIIPSLSNMVILLVVYIEEQVSYYPIKAEMEFYCLRRKNTLAQRNQPAVKLPADCSV